MEGCLEGGGWRLEGGGWRLEVGRYKKGFLYKISIKFFYTYLMKRREEGGWRLFFWFGLVWRSDSWKLELDS